MSESCCNKQEKINNSLLLRSIIMLTLGLVMTIPFIELSLVSGWFGYLCFSIATLFLGISISSDFTDKIWFFTLLVFSIGTILIAPLFFNPLTVKIMIVLSILACLLGLFIKKETIDLIIMKCKNLITNNRLTSKQNLDSFFEFPSTQKLILLFVTISWATTFASFFPIFSSIYSFVIQESFLVYGAYNLSSYIKFNMQSKLLPHNHAETVKILDPNGTEQEVLINTLKKDMIVRINQSTLLPIDVESKETCIISNDVNEKRISLVKGRSIQKNTFIHQGSVICKENYKPTSHAYQRAHSENDDFKLNIMMFSTFLFALFAGISQGFLIGSVAIGLKYFATNLIIACPCVYFVVKSIFSQKLLQWLDNNRAIHFNKMPTRGKPNILVFDRTHTLYEENPANPEGPYILNKDAKALLKHFKKNGVQCYILSGHGNLANKVNCQNELGEFIKKDNVIFDTKFHDPNRALKKDIIKNLQLYGTPSRPKHFLTRLKHHCKNIFVDNVVGMIGDGDNDVMAMKQADLSISVSKNNFNTNNNVLKEANFHINQSALLKISSLLDVVNQSSRYINLFLWTGFFINVSMLIIVNGFIPSVLILSASTACVIMPVVCVIIIGLSTMMTINHQNVPDHITHSISNEQSCGCCSKKILNLECKTKQLKKEKVEMKKHNKRCSCCIPEGGVFNLERIQRSKSQSPDKRFK